MLFLNDTSTTEFYPAARTLSLHDALPILPGRAADPRDAIKQALAAERIGLGGVFASERFESKESGVTMGALSQTTEQLKLAVGLTQDRKSKRMNSSH